ncbi:MAG: ABC transporter permease [Bacteroidales bacterium]|nr:ABC transporter permease [Bacteroidales bacterium]
MIKRKNRKEYRAVSLSELTWKRFRKEKQGMVSLAFIVLVIAIAVLGYLVTPDSTPYCNHQQLEIALRSPGFSAKMLQLNPAQEIPQYGLFHKMLYGQPDKYRTVPIESYRTAGDSVYVHLIDASGEPEVAYHKSEVCKDQPVITRKFLLGTDRYGRDVLSQLLIGTRISLAVGGISVLIALIIGILIGSIAGYFRGWVDDVLMWFINVVWSIPTLLLVIAISFALGKGFWQIFMAIGFTMWVDVARVVRGQMISLREKEFVEAGKALGYNSFHIIRKHLLPNVAGTVIVIAASNFSSAILMEAGLSFLGLGVQPPTPSWGMMMKENYAYIVLDNAYLAIIPGIAIMLLVLAFMLIGNALRDALSVRDQ